MYLNSCSMDLGRDNVGVCGCVMSPTSGIYWVDLGFINNYKESQL